MNLSVVSRAFLFFYLALVLNDGILCSNETSESKESTEVNVQKLKVSVTDPNDATKVESLDSSEYEVKEESEGTTVTFKNDYKATNVKIKGKEVWTHDPNKNDGKKPNSITYNSDKTKVVLNFDGLEITCEKDNDGNWTSSEQVKQNEDKKENEEAKKSKKKKPKAKENQEGTDSTSNDKKTTGEENDADKASE